MSSQSPNITFKNAKITLDQDISNNNGSQRNNNINESTITRTIFPNFHIIKRNYLNYVLMVITTIMLSLGLIYSVFLYYFSLNTKNLPLLNTSVLMLILILTFLLCILFVEIQNQIFLRCLLIILLVGILIVFVVAIIEWIRYFNNIK